MHAHDIQDLIDQVGGVSEPVDLLNYLAHDIHMRFELWIEGASQLRNEFDLLIVAVGIGESHATLLELQVLGGQ